MNLLSFLRSTPRRRLACALILASGFSNVLSRDAWRRAWRALKAMVGLFGEPTKTGYWYIKRLETCRKCVLFYAPLQTCGSPLNRDWPDGGCWCNQEFAARVPEKTCWLDDELGHDSNAGWNAAGVSPEQVCAPK